MLIETLDQAIESGLINQMNGRWGWRREREALDDERTFGIRVGYATGITWRPLASSSLSPNLSFFRALSLSLSFSPALLSECSAILLATAAAGSRKDPSIHPSKRGFIPQDNDSGITLRHEIGRSMTMTMMMTMTMTMTTITGACRRVGLRRRATSAATTAKRREEEEEEE